MRLLDPAQVVVLRTPGGMLEVATLVKTEEFGWRSSHTCPVLDCGEIFGYTVSRARVPAHYVYRVPLAETWELRLQGNEYVLTVPAPQLKLPVAIESSKLEIESKRGSWLSPPVGPNVQSLMRRLEAELGRRALQPEYLQAQRASAAKTIAEFAQKWMAEQVKTPGRPVRVQFKDADGG